MSFCHFFETQTLTRWHPALTRWHCETPKKCLFIHFQKKSSSISRPKFWRPCCILYPPTARLNCSASSVPANNLPAVQLQATLFRHLPTALSATALPSLLVAGQYRRGVKLRIDRSWTNEGQRFRCSVWWQ